MDFECDPSFQVWVRNSVPGFDAILKSTSLVNDVVCFCDGL